MEVPVVYPQPWNIFRSAKQRKPIQLDTSDARRAAAVRYMRRVSRAVAMIIVVSMCSLPVAVEAGMVFGRVTLDRQPFPPRGSFVLATPNGDVRVQTDDNGNYEVVLGPGAYTVRYADAQGVRWEAQIRAYPGPLRQDIVFKRR